MINTKFLLFITLVIIAITYCIFIPTNQIINIILDEYITIGITFVSFIVYQYFKIKLKSKPLREFLPNTNYVPIKSTILFFIIFQVVDFYSEDGLVGMIKLWFMYWIFGVMAYFITHNINLYKNYKLS